jgi:rhodanese-related sulfurtransferase
MGCAKLDLSGCQLPGIELFGSKTVSRPNAAHAQQQTMDTAFSEIPLISPRALMPLLGRPQSPLLLDVRRRSTFAAQPTWIAGACWVDPERVKEFASSRAPGEVVVYCQYGHSVSAEAANVLRAAGWRVQKLAGGIAGGEVGVDDDENIADWVCTELPKVHKRDDWGLTGLEPSRWVTRARPKIDRLACPWLVRRFIDPWAEFLYLPASQVLAVARERGAVSYDADGAQIAHLGDWCTFDALLQGTRLNTPALQLLATVVRGADTGRASLADASSGLRAISLGMSRIHSDDHSLLEAMMPVYDALYAWCFAQALGPIDAMKEGQQ